MAYDYLSAYTYQPTRGRSAVDINTENADVYRRRRQEAAAFGRATINTIIGNWDPLFGAFERTADDAAVEGLGFRADLRGIGDTMPRRRALSELDAGDWNPLEAASAKRIALNASASDLAFRLQQQDALRRAQYQQDQQDLVNDLQTSDINRQMNAALPAEATTVTRGVDAAGRPMLSARPATPPTLRDVMLRSVPGTMRPGLEKTFAEMDMKRQSAQNESAKITEEARHNKAMESKKTTTDEVDAAMIEDAAKNILANPRDLTSIRTITSLRGDQRLKLFNEIKKRDPEFNVGNIDRQIKFLDNYEDPKGRAAINRGAMNNILQHAADLSDVNKEYSRANARILNTPIGILSRQGGEEWSKFATPLAVLKDELALYFAGGYAPTVDQQKTWDKIASDTATPAQIEQFAKDIIHVGLRRADTHNEQFKTMMGYDDPNLLTPQAVQAGEHLGLGAAVKKYGSGGTIGRTGAPFGTPTPHPKGSDPGGIR